MPFKGDNAGFGYKIETTFDESPAQGTYTTWLGIIPSAEFDDAPEWKDYHTINSSRDMFLENQGKILVTGSVPLELQNGRVLYLAMGGLVETGTSPKTHTITGAATIPSICIEAVYKGTNPFLRYYRGTKVDSLEIEAVDGGEVKATIALQSARGQKSSNTASTISTVTTVPFMYYNGSVTWDAYGDFDITTWKWKISNNLKPRHTVRTTDGKYAKMIIEGKREYEITANVIIPDAATYNSKIYDDLIAKTIFNMTLSLIRTAASDEMVLTASNCTVRHAPHNIPETGEEVEISVTIKPRTCTWVVKDAISTYLS